jgi:hypothetical protein
MIRALRVFASAGAEIGEESRAPGLSAYSKGARRRRQKRAPTKNAKRARRPVCFTVC